MGCERCDDDWKTRAAEATDEAIDGAVRAGCSAATCDDDGDGDGSSCLIGKDLRRLFSLAAAAALMMLLLRILLLVMLLLLLLCMTSTLEGMPS